MKSNLEIFLKKQIWDGRAFIETGQQVATLEATRFGLEAALRSGISLGIERDVKDWVQSMWRLEGGFAVSPDSGVTDLASTYYAVRLLIMTEDRSFLHEIAKPLTHWLQSQWQKSENQNVDALYYLVRALDLLAAPAGRNLSAEWQEFLRGCRVRSGGFGNLPGDPGDIEHTYCASHLLLILGAGTSDLVDGWAEECMRPDGWIVWSPTEPRYSHATLYWGSHLALILNIHRQWEATLPLISKTQNPDGGFGLNGSSLWHVYCAVSSRLITEIMLGRRMRTDLVVE